MAYHACRADRTCYLTEACASCRRLAALLGELERRLRAGEVIYLHCWGGRGRAGTVGATLLHQLFGLDAEEALERVQRAYSTRNDIERARRTCWNSDPYPLGRDLVFWAFVSSHS